MSDDYPLGADSDTDAIREMRNRSFPDMLRDLGIELPVATPCRMRQQYPFDFAWCETHDETFPLGSVCRFHRPDFPANGAGNVAGSTPGLPATPKPPTPTETPAKENHSGHP